MKPPHPATVKKPSSVADPSAAGAAQRSTGGGRPPHPATVSRGRAVQPSMAKERSPHPATVSRGRAVQPSMAKERSPHPATVSRGRAAQPSMAKERSPHPATVSRGRAVQPSMAKERPPHPATIGRTVIQRMEKDSGRSPGELWKLFVGYRKDQAKEIEDEFLKQGYTIENVSKAVTTAIRALGLDLPAHGTGGTDSGVQGDLDEAVKVWVSKLTQWAKDNPKSEKKKTKGRQQTEEQKTKTDTKKSEKKQNSKDQKHIDWHNKNPHKKCSRPGCKL